MALYYDNPDQLQEVDSYIELLRGQDDRSCVIMIAARIESLLESAIDRRLIDPQNRNRSGILSNLANTINLSYRLGILHATHADALHALRRIRNSAAHFDEPMSLEDHERDVEDFFRPWVDGRAGAMFRPFVEQEQAVGARHARARFLVAASIFFVFFKPLATVVPRLDPLSWLWQVGDD